eukprot:g553.t1
MAVQRANAVSVAHRALPAVAAGLRDDAVTICLCYQYKEPAWTRKQHKAVRNRIIELAAKHRVTGRGRCAPEGLNCTLTAGAQDMRDFCYALRAYDALFAETDFKLEDGLAASSRFKLFSLRKTDELVNYGLSGVKAPSIARHAGKHLEAHEYHEAMKDEDAVIIDVRNRYESAIGHFQPPPGGAQLIDPQMRNSSDFPKWLNSSDTKAKLNGKKVMMYCTGGIRCERATALLNQMTAAEGEDGFHTKDVVMVRGGIERYLKTFPEGGFWKGKNYLFDQRMEQTPERKSAAALAADVETVCCLCKARCAEYRGRHKCAHERCRVPVIVCARCQARATAQPAALCCPLCEAGHAAPTAQPELVHMKRKLGVIDASGVDSVSGALVGGDGAAGGDPRAERLLRKRARAAAAGPAARLFVGRLPRVITATALREALAWAAEAGGGGAGARVVALQWCVDRDTGAFYGSAFAEMATLGQAKTAVAWASRKGGLEVRPVAGTGVGASGGDGRGDGKAAKPRLARLNFAPLREGEAWPPAGLGRATECPPIGSYVS